MIFISPYFSLSLALFAAQTGSFFQLYTYTLTFRRDSNRYQQSITQPHTPTHIYKQRHEQRTEKLFQIPLHSRCLVVSSNRTDKNQQWQYRHIGINAGLLASVSQENSAAQKPSAEGEVESDARSDVDNLCIGAADDIHGQWSAGR